MSRYRLVCRVAAGPRIGFGHLIRCRTLARALNADLVVSIRGATATRNAARRLGYRVTDAASDRALASLEPRLVVVDDPSGADARVWVARARRVGVPVATIHDLGIGYVPADIGIDGSVTRIARMHGRIGDLRGPRYALLDPRIAAMREAQPRRTPGRILIALGGGAHVYAWAARLSRTIAARMPDADIRIAAGFIAPRRLPAIAPGRWISAPDGLAEELAAASIAVLAGGVTLYEACALGTPAIAVAVVPAQRRTIHAFAARGAVIDAGAVGPSRQLFARVARQTAALAASARARQALAAAGKRTVDGRGVFRVAAALRSLCGVMSGPRIAMARQPRALLFDLDDTLYPLRRFRLSGFRAVARHLADRHGIDARRAYGELVRASRETPRRAALQVCLARFGLPADMVPALVELMRSHRPSMNLPPDARRVLSGLKEGWRLGIVTNGRPDLQARKIEALGLDELLDTIVLAHEHTERGKPDRTPFVKALRALGVPPSQAVFVGDDDRCDLLGASRLGIKTVFIGRYKEAGFDAPRCADASVATLAELPAVAAALLQTRGSRHVA